MIFHIERFRIFREAFMQKLEKQFHIHCVEGDVGRYVILPGAKVRPKGVADAHTVEIP